MNLVIGLFVVVGAFLGFAATRPGTFRIARSIQINMPAESIFPNIADFHRWAEWSPWEQMDPAMKKTIAGSVYEWEGNSKVGKGRMEIVDSAPPDRLTIKLDFLKPFEAHNTTYFTLEPKGAATDVTWSMEGTNPFGMKVMGIFMNMDKMVGRDFEAGLVELKRVSEA